MKGDLIGAQGTYRTEENATKSVLLENMKNKGCL
jgi:hypothetical protein